MPERANRQAIPVCYEHIHGLARGPKCLTKMKLENQTPGLWDLQDLRPQSKGKVERQREQGYIPRRDIRSANEAAA